MLASDCVLPFQRYRPRRSSRLHYSHWRERQVNYPLQLDGWLGGSAPDNCPLTASEQYDVVSHRRRFLPLPWPLFGAAFCLWALSGVPPTVSQVSMGTMVCFLANASINPQTGSAIWPLVSGPKLT